MNRFRNIFLFAFTFLGSSSLQAQDSLNLADVHFINPIKSKFTQEQAFQDIANKTICFALCGGFLGMPEITSKHRKFEKKYGIRFVTLGCMDHAEGEDIEGYESIVFAYLDGKFGNSWRKELNQCKNEL